MKKILLYLFLSTAFAVQVIGQTPWIKDPNNPVLPRGTNGEWDDALVANPYVLFNGTDYQMWYAGYDGSTSTNIGYATSPDGITWNKYSGNPVLTTGPSGSWDDVTDYQPSVIFDGTTYHMWFGGHEGTNRRIGYATSPDGITWTKYSGNPVLTTGSSGSWDDLWVDSPNVLYKDGVYHMYYSGNDGTITQSGHATSLDGITWDKDALNPVLTVESGEWDDIMCYQPSVLFDGSMYHMWYSGGGAFFWRIGYAYSLDGRNWIKAPYNPVLETGSSGSWDDAYAGLCGVIFNEDSSGFKIWYTGGNGFVRGDIGYATAPKPPIDFANNPLIKYSHNPVLPRGMAGEWNSVAVGSPTIIYDGTLYHMWYNGADGNNANIGYATSTDKINWDKHPTPVLEHGSYGSWDALFILHPTVYFDGTIYHMWYTGTDGAVPQIGYATSTDPINNWTKYSGNPVLKPEERGGWDGQGVNSPEVLYIDGVFHMWYGGSDGNYEQTGHATSFDGITWDKDDLNPVLKVGGAGSWDRPYSSQPSVLFDGTNYHMFYDGGPAFGWKIGYAYSEDGRNWNKDDTNNPLLEEGSAGDWDSEYVGYQTVLFNSDSTEFDMWYIGAASTGYVSDIGFASTDTSDHNPSSVEDNKIDGVPTAYSLSQNYPNPFNPSTKIIYSVPQSSRIEIKVFDLLGNEIETLIKEEKPAGTYELHWNAENLSSGIYFYKIQAGDFIKTKKMIFLK